MLKVCSEILMLEGGNSHWGVIVCLLDGGRWRRLCSLQDAMVLSNVDFNFFLFWSFISLVCLWIGEFALCKIVLNIFAVMRSLFCSIVGMLASSSRLAVGVEGRAPSAVRIPALSAVFNLFRIGLGVRP